MSNVLHVRFFRVSGNVNSPIANKKAGPFAGDNCTKSGYTRSYRRGPAWSYMFEVTFKSTADIRYYDSLFLQFMYV